MNAPQNESHINHTCAASKTPPIQPSVTPKRRGRPRKNQQQQTPSLIQPSSQPLAATKRRGRPRKTPAQPSSTPVPPSSSPPTPLPASPPSASVPPQISPLSTSRKSKRQPKSSSRKTQEVRTAQVPAPSHEEETISSSNRIETILQPQQHQYSRTELATNLPISPTSQHLAHHEPAVADQEIEYTESHGHGDGEENDAYQRALEQLARAEEAIAAQESD